MKKVENCALHQIIHKCYYIATEVFDNCKRWCINGIAILLSNIAEQLNIFIKYALVSYSIPTSPDGPAWPAHTTSDPCFMELSAEETAVRQGYINPDGAAFWREARKIIS